MNQKEYWEREELKNRRGPEHPVIAAYVLPKIQLISRYVNLTKTTRLLDVGCGNGFFTYYFDQICDVYGVDYSERMLALNPVKKTSIMDASELKFEDNSFDVAFCHALLHHVNDIDRVFSEMKRVSKKYIIAIEPNRNNPLVFLFSLLKKQERGGLRFSLPFLKDVALRNETRIAAAFSHGILVPNKTPVFLLPIARMFDFKNPLGITNFLIAMK